MLSKSIGFGPFCLLRFYHNEILISCASFSFRLIEKVDPLKAAQLYGQAAEVSSIESKSLQAAEYASKSARVYIKLKNYSEALKMLEKQMALLQEAPDERACGRLVVHLVLVQLSRDDVVAASKVFGDYIV